ncbi:Protein M3 [Mortierella sp. GBA30]|nr:Protein M3 [Mortierella sp. GBA30]
MARNGLLSPAGAKVVAGMILNYTLPALLFAKMVTCVNQGNIEELGFVALIAVLYILLGGLLGLMIQRTGLVPKRLYWGIVAATMFTNFGDLPISIILAVSDHPPFLVGDGARGTAYSSVFIAVFYLFLFPLGGYRLIRYDHIKESKRLQNMTTQLHNHGNHGSSQLSNENSGDSLSGDTLTAHPGHKAHVQKLLSSPDRQPMRQDPNGLQSSFSATSTMISMDFNMEEHAKEMRYRPHDHPLDQDSSYSPQDAMYHPRDRSDDTVLSPTSPSPSPSPIRETNPFIRHNFDSHSGTGSRGNGSSHSSPSQSYTHPSYPLHALRSSDTGTRHSVESMASNGTGATRFTPGHDDDHHLIKGAVARKKSIKSSPLYKSYQPPPLRQPPATASSSASLRSPSPSPYISLTPPIGSHRNENHATEAMATVPLEIPVPAEDMTTPIPKVPPHLSKSYETNHKKEEVHVFWRVFHSTREYLTPPTIGLIIGLIVALTPLRKLFVLTDDPLPSLDDLPPLSFILEVTLMLGGCCVPLGLTVLGASLSRLKPGRMRPLIPALTMITIAKMVISPLVGILLVQLVLVNRFGWVNAQNHMLRFTLTLMSGSPTSILCFVLAQVWDRRTKNAGSEMAALIAVQYAVATVSLTVGCAFMMYFLF